MDTIDRAEILNIIATIANLDINNKSFITNVNSYLNKLDHKKINETYPDKTQRFELIATNYLNKIKTDKPKVAQYDPYAHDKRLGMKESSKLAEMPTAGWLNENMSKIIGKTINVYINTIYRNIEVNQYTTIKDFAFTMIPAISRTKRISNGIIPIREELKNITYFKLGSFVLPYTSAQRSRNYLNELNITFTSIRANGAMDNEETYHFCLTYIDHPSNNELVIVKPANDYCRFNPPLTYLDDISFRISDPIYPIIFHADRLLPSSFSYLSSDGRISFSQPHNLDNGDIIIIKGLETNDDQLNQTILDQINDIRGIEINVISPSQIATGIDFSLLTNIKVSSLPEIQVYSRTFRFPIEIGYQ
jgi:hypothetical protein